MKQETIVDEKPDVKGIKCYVRCTSNKIDTAKENVRSINFNFDIRVGDQLIGTGNNLNINNISPETYILMCNAFGVEDIDEDTPFAADLMTLLNSEKKQAWIVAMGRKDKKVDKDQADVTKDPNMVTDKQLALIHDWKESDKLLNKIVVKFLKEANLDHISKLNKAQAQDLIAQMKPEEEEQFLPHAKDKSGEKEKAKKPAKK
jgi:hypothetical protein